MPKPPPADPALAFAARQAKVAQFLIAEDLADDAATHQKAATKALAQASAIENHVRESPSI
ncbi:MAG: hypothetical protein WCK77_21170 [Verrucomicrobiota bacterium]